MYPWKAVPRTSRRLVIRASAYTHSPRWATDQSPFSASSISSMSATISSSPIPDSRISAPSRPLKNGRLMGSSRPHTSRAQSHQSGSLNESSASATQWRYSSSSDWTFCRAAAPPGAGAASKVLLRPSCSSWRMRATRSPPPLRRPFPSAGP